MRTTLRTGIERQGFIGSWQRVNCLPYIHNSGGGCNRKLSEYFEPYRSDPAGTVSKIQIILHNKEQYKHIINAGFCINQTAFMISCILNIECKHESILKGVVETGKDRYYNKRIYERSGNFCRYVS